MTEAAVFGGGCFWCIEAAFKEVEGVEKVTSGYAGGDADNPSYREVCTGKTGHAEVVEIEYKPSEVSYEELLDTFFRIHDPTQVNRQGPDTGSQYRSIILYRDDGQRRTANEKIDEIQEEYEEEIATEVEPLEEFYPAEEKHQDYFEKNPNDAYCRMHVEPKVRKVRKVPGEE